MNDELDEVKAFAGSLYRDLRQLEDKYVELLQMVLALDKVVRGLKERLPSKKALEFMGFKRIGDE